MTRLVQISIVRNERDIIRENLLHHRHLGVDAAAVIDNGSRDGTWEILQDLSRQIDLVLIREEGITMHDPIWREKLLGVARGALEGDWIVPVDADEFWMPPTADLRSLLDTAVGVLVARRYNVLPGSGLDQEDVGDFRRSALLVRRPFPHRTWKQIALGAEDSTPHYPILMGQIGPKVLCRLEGLQNLEYGYHDAQHADGSRELSDSCHLLHFPVRSFEQFRAKVRSHSRSHHLPWYTEQPRVSWHLKYWHRLELEGRLEAEYRSFFLSQQLRRDFLGRGILEHLASSPLLAG